MRPERLIIGRVLLIGCLLTAAAVLAQQTGSTGSGGATTTPSTPTTTPSSPTTTPTPTPTTTPTRPPYPTPYPTDAQPSTTTPTDRFPQESARPVYLTGKVILEDGTPPPDSVTIERNCNGVVRPEGYTDSKGRFSIQLGQNPFLFADASVGSSGSMPGFGSQSSSNGGFNPAGGGISERDLMGCEIRASLVGYRSDLVSLAGRRYLDRPDVGTIVLHRYVNVPGTTISLTSLAAPKDAAKAFDKGRDAVRKEKWEEARKQFEKAVEGYPKYAAAWYELGLTLEHLKDVPGAGKAYQRAFAADERFLPPYLQLASMAIEKRDWSEVVARTDQVVKLDPMNFPVIYLYNSIGQFNLNNMDASEKSAREALKLDTAHRYPDANRVLGVILARRGDFEGAAENLKAYLKLAPNAPESQAAKDQLAKIEQLAKGTPTDSIGADPKLTPPPR
jgi:tetratricopeptide (TPR) repeat protein